MLLSKLDTVKALLDRMDTRSKKLDDILSGQKAEIDKYGIGYTDGASMSNAKGKNILLKVQSLLILPLILHTQLLRRIMCLVLHVFSLAIIVDLKDTHLAPLQ